MSKMISLFGSSVGADELSAVQDCFNRQWLGIGPKTTEFEKKLAQKLNVKNFVFLNSGSNSLLLALKLLNLPKGSEVILPSFTWIACANAVKLNQLKPVFCDVDRITCNMRPEDVEKKITKHTSAIMVVHYAGKPVDMDGMRKFGLPIIEDAAHAIDSYYKGKHCGAIGDVGIFSFDAVKNLTTGEGGGLVAKDPASIERAFKLRYCGIAKSGFQASAEKQRWWEYEITDFFPKLLNTDLAASIGLIQLERLAGFQQRRKEIWNKYSEAFTKESWANTWIEAPPGPEPHEQHSYFTYCIKVHGNYRDKLARFLFENGVYTSLRFHPLHLNSIFKSKDRLPNSEWLNESALNIPLHHRLSDSEVEHILKNLKEFKRLHI